MTDYKTIKLDYSHEYTVSIPTYEKVKAIIEAERICEQCKKQYTNSNIEVIKNTCLSCALKKDSYKDLTFIEKVENECQFLDTTGYIHTSQPHYDSITKNNRKTLTYYGFSFPMEYNEHKLYNDIYIFGDVTKDNCVIVSTSFNSWINGEYKDTKVIYFCFKNGANVEVNKRKKYVQQLYKQAKEQSILPNGQYSVNGNEFYWLPDWWLDTLVAQKVEQSKL